MGKVLKYIVLVTRIINIKKKVLMKKMLKIQVTFKETLKIHREKKSFRF